MMWLDAMDMVVILFTAFLASIVTYLLMKPTSNKVEENRWAIPAAYPFGSPLSISNPYRRRLTNISGRSPENVSTADISTRRASLMAKGTL